MIDLEKIVGFDWDQNNIHKSYKKHGITPNQSEEIFLDSKLRYLPDLKHSGSEPRYFAVGRTRTNKWLFISFTIRKNKIRIISARGIHQRERVKYEK